jgi:hypothetical protein
LAPVWRQDLGVRIKTFLIVYYGNKYGTLN